MHALALPHPCSLFPLSLHSLGDNQIGAEGCRALAEALQTNTSLTTLKYVRGRCSARSFPSLTLALSSPHPFLRSLLDNKIGAEGCRALAEALKTNTSLTTL